MENHCNLCNNIGCICWTPPFLSRCAWEAWVVLETAMIRPSYILNDGSITDHPCVPTSTRLNHGGKGSEHLGIEEDENERKWDEWRCKNSKLVGFVTSNPAAGDASRETVEVMRQSTSRHLLHRATTHPLNLTLNFSHNSCVLMENSTLKPITFFLRINGYSSYCKIRVTLVDNTGHLHCMASVLESRRRILMPRVEDNTYALITHPSSYQAFAGIR